MEQQREEEEPLITQEERHGSSYSSRFRLLGYLYVSHFLTRWGSRMWEFGIGLFMIAIWPDSLLLTSLYGLVENLAVFSMGVTVGKWVDKTRRLKVLQISLGTRNGSVVAAALALAILLIDPDLTFGGYKIFASLIVLVNLFGGLSALSALATNIAVERDWVLAVAEGQRIATLTELNSAMRGIDLTCKLMAPVLVGMIMSFVSVLAAAILLCVWNVVSIGFEYYLLRCLYSESPELQQERIAIGNSNDRKKLVPNIAKESTDPATDDKFVSSCVSEETEVHVPNIAEESIDPATDKLVSSVSEEAKEANESVNSFQSGDRSHTTYLSQRLWEKVCQWTSRLGQSALQLHIVEGFKVYAAQEMVLAAVALSMLYFTVLSFGSLMTAALSWRGIPTYIIGLVRGFAALVGISASLSYPKFHGRLQTMRTGLWSIVMQWSFLSLCVISNWISNSTASSALLMGGVVTSRFGLWMFDLAVLQLMQESTAEHERGIVGGVQKSMQSFLEMLSFVAGIIISNPKDFDKLVYLSYGAVTMSLILYSVQVYRVRGHLLHLDRIFKSR